MQSKRSLVSIYPTPDNSLAMRLSWLTGLRLVLLTAFLIITITLNRFGFWGEGRSRTLAVITIGCAYAVAAVYAVWLRRRRALELLANLQLAGDQLVWTLMVYITGGATSVATSLYGLTCLLGAVLVGLRGAVISGFSGIALFVALCLLLTSGILLPPADSSRATYPTDWEYIQYPVAVNIFAICVVTILASYLAARLSSAGGRIAAANARAEEAERWASLGRLAQGLAHEIRNPLGSIAGSVELLRTGGHLNHEDQQLCTIVEREASRLNDLVEDMLNLSRPKVPHRIVMDVAAIARDVVLLASKSGRGGDVHTHYEGSSSAMISADSSQMRQVIWNLVRNAIQASAPGDQVLVRVLKERDNTCIEVHDNGPGISEEAKEQLFDAFFTTRSHGMGIGLAVVKRIVQDHGFSIEVENLPEKGALFRVRMPSHNV